MQERLKCVRIKLSRKRPKEISSISSPMRYCEMVLSAKETPFYATPQHQSCEVARFFLGLQGRNERFLDHIKEVLIKFDHIEDGSYLNPLSLLEVEKRYFIFSTSWIDEDLRIYIGTPRDILQILKRFTKKEPLHLTLFGFASFCQESTAVPLVKENINISLGCCGARKAGLMDTHLILSLPRGYFDGV